MSSSIKNIVVIGSHGKVGQQLIRQISKTNLKATASVRNQTQAETIKSISDHNPNITTRPFLVDESSVLKIADELRGHDAVVFTAGSAGKDLLRVDLDGAVKTFEAAVLAQVKRLIIVSAIYADRRDVIEKSSLRPYYLAKHYADRILVDEFSDKLDYTILKPTALTDDEATGKIMFSRDGEAINGQVTRADVAATILLILDNKDTYGRSYDFANGDLSISDPATFK